MIKYQTYIICFLSAIFIQTGCAVRYTPSDSQITSGEIPSFSVSEPIRIVNAQTSSSDVILPVHPYKLSVNHKQYTDTAIKLLIGEIEKRGGKISGDASKVINVSIIDVKIATTMKFRCIINFTVETGDAYFKGFEVAGGSWDYEKAIDLAMANVVIKTLNNDGILRYLK